MKKVFALSFSVIFIFALVVICFAHPGGTDSNGGHYDRDSGEYHYHHGYPAHQHEDYMCPYEPTAYDCNIEDCTINTPHYHWITEPETTTEKHEYTTETTTKTTEVKEYTEKKFSLFSDFIIPVIKWFFNIIYWLFIICLLPIGAYVFNKIRNELKK